MTYTRDQVNKAVNDGIDLITMDNDIYLSDRDQDLLNLAVNAALHKLDNPDADLDDVILSSYQPDLDRYDDYVPVVSAFGRVGYIMPELSDEDYQARAVEEVRGWIDR